MTNKELKEYLDKLDEKLDTVRDDVNEIKTKLKDKEKNENHNWEKQKRNLDIKLIIWGLIISAGNIGIRFMWR
jgi:lipid II:glycine glycyltransferase (peptidoglycan interpeptide bridge formation enzyme)